MIVREWRARASRDKIQAYPSHFRQSVVPALRTVPGFCGADLCRRTLGDSIEFLVLTRWQTMEAIRGFAGQDVENAVVEPSAAAALDDFDDRVRHYEVVGQASPD